MKLSDEARAAIAAIGRKGGQTKGSTKRRSPEHYARLAAMKRKKAKK